MSSIILLLCVLCNFLYLYFSIENGQPREPPLCRLYRNTFVPCYLSGIWSSCRFWHSFHTVLSMSQFAPVSDCKFSGADAVRYSLHHLDRKWFCRRYVTFYVFISKCLTELVYWDWSHNMPAGRLYITAGRPSVCLSHRSTATAGAQQQWCCGTALSSKCRQCHVDSWVDEAECRLAVVLYV